MNARELRIGNLIEKHDGTVFTVTAKFLFEYEGHENEMLLTSPPKHFYSPIPITEEWLKKFGFEKKPLYGWKGNGYDWQPETSRTDNQDFVLWMESLQRYFIFRYETSSYRKQESDPWESDVCRSIHMISDYYERCNESIPFGKLDNVHQLQNLFFALTGEGLTIKE